MSREKYRDDTRLAERLKSARERLDFTYRDAARFIGCSPGYLSNIEKLRYRPSELFRRAAEEWLNSIEPTNNTNDVSKRYGKTLERSPEDVHPDAWPAIRALLPRLSLIYEAKELLAHAQRWGWIAGNIETFSDIVKDDVEAHRKAKRKARDAG